MSINPTELTAMLLADSTPAGPVPIPTRVNGVNVSAVLELQSTTRAFLLPRMTTVQRDAMAVITNGMMIYNITPGAEEGVNTYDGTTWTTEGGGDVDGPASSTTNSLSVFADTTGKVITTATNVLLSPVTSIISGLASLASGLGSAAAPTYSFTGDSNTGWYSTGGDQLAAATGGGLQLSIVGDNTSVNYLQVRGSATGIPLTITALGTDADVSIGAITKGAGQFLTGNGTLAAPAYSFTGSATTRACGLYLTIGGTTQTNYTALVTSTRTAALNGNGVLSIGTTTFDATGTNTLALLAGTVPTGVANVLQVYGATIGGNTGTLGLRIPTGSVTGSVDNVVENKIQVSINNVTYYLLATTSAA